MKAIKYIATVLGLFLFISCTDKEVKVSNDVTLLKKIIKLDVNPISVRFLYESVNGGILTIGPTDYDFTAILQLSEEDFIKLKKYHQQNFKLNNELYLSTEFAAGKWYSNSILEYFDIQKGHAIINVDTYSADYFSKGALLNGFCFFTENNEVFIHLYTT